MLIETVSCFALFFSRLLAGKQSHAFYAWLFTLFICKDELNPYWLRVTDSTGTEEDTPVILNEGKALYGKLPYMSLTEGIHALDTFQSEIEAELGSQRDSGEGSVKKYEIQLVCELAVVHRQKSLIAVQYQDDQLYIDSYSYYQKYIKECTDLRELH